MISTVRCALHSLDAQCDAHGLYMVSTDRLKLLLVFTRATKRLVAINQVKITSLCLHNMCVYCVLGLHDISKNYRSRDNSICDMRIAASCDKCNLLCQAFVCCMHR